MNVQIITGPHTTDLTEILVAIARQRFPEHSWQMLVITDEDSGWQLELRAEAADLLLSFLNPYVVPGSSLRTLEGRAYNVHPSTPEFPGVAPMNFAYYAGHLVAGATLHRMESSIDSGPIYAVAEEAVAADIGLPAFTTLCLHLALRLAVEQLPRLLEGDLRPNGRRWREDNMRRRRDFLEMCRIPLDASRDEVGRRLAAFYHPGLSDKPFLELHGHRFVYEPPPAEDP